MENIDMAAKNRLLNAELVDAEVHIGKDLYGHVGRSGKRSEVNADLSIIKKMMPSLNLTKALLIPPPTFRLAFPDGSLEEACIWNAGPEGRITYRNITVNAGKRNEVINQAGPYANMNKWLLNLAASQNAELGKRRFYFVPLMHPKLDRPADLESLLNNELTVAVKLHGIGTHSSSADAPEWAAKLLNKYDIPFFLHTDYYLHRNINSLDDFHRLMVANRALDWAKWIEKMGARAYLAHGARIDREAAKLVNDGDSLVVGSGPDSVLNMEKERMHGKYDDYLTALFDTFDSNKILFSSDFAWNFNLEKGDDSLDWGSKARIVEHCIARGLGSSEIIGILSKNAVRFFKL